MLNDQEDIQKRFLRIKLIYNGATLTETLTGTIDYIIDDVTYNNEMLQSIKDYRNEHGETKIVDIAYFSDILEKKF